MKKLIASLVFMACALAARADIIQYDRVNPVMQVIAEALTKADDMVLYARPEFDEKFCDLNAERIRYSLNAEIKDSPWLPGTKTVITASSKVIVDRKAEHPGINIESIGEVQSDTLAMVRHAASLALPKLTSLDPKFEARIRSQIERAARVNSLNDLYDLLVDGKNLSADVVTDQLLHHTSASNEGLESVLEAIQKGEITKLPATGAVKKIVVVNHFAFHFLQQHEWVSETVQIPLWFKAKTGILEIQATGLKVVGEVFSEQQTKDLDKTKRDLQKRLLGLQSGDLDEKERTFRLFRDALFKFKTLAREGTWPR